MAQVASLGALGRVGLVGPVGSSDGPASLLTRLHAWADMVSSLPASNEPTERADEYAARMLLRSQARGPFLGPVNGVSRAAYRGLLGPRPTWAVLGVPAAPQLDAAVAEHAR